MNILRPSQTAQKVAVSLPTLWRRVKQDPDFPQPVKMSGGVTGFIESEIDTYLTLKVDTFRANPSKRAQASIAATASVVKRATKRAAIHSAQGAKKGGA